MPDEQYEKAVELSKKHYRRSRMWALAFAAGAFLVFAYFTFDGIRFFAGSSAAEATVTRLQVEKHQSISRGVPDTISYRPYVEFQDSNGTLLSRKLAAVIGFGFDTSVGDSLQIRYNPKMPEDVRLAGFLQFWMPSFFSLGLIAIALGFALIFTVIKPNRTIINYYLNKM